MTSHPPRLLFQSDLLRIEAFCCPGHGFASHREEWALAHEIVLVRRGVYLRYDAFGKIVADANHALFFHAGKGYQIAHPVGGGDVSTIFTLAPPVLLDMLASHDPAAVDRPDAPFPAGSAVVHPGHHLAQSCLLQYLAATDGEPLPIEEMALELLASVMASACVGRRHGVHPAPSVAAHGDLVADVKLLLAGQLGDRLTVGQIAAAVYCSPYHLCRVFKRRTGLTIHAYRHRLRLARALDTLAGDPAADLTALALDLGFSSHTHFTTAFTRAFGITPSAFRRSRQVVPTPN